MNQALKWLKQRSQEVASPLHFSLTLTGVSGTLHLKVQVFEPVATQEGEYCNKRNHPEYHRKVHQIPPTRPPFLLSRKYLNAVLELPFFWRRREGKGSKVHVVLNLTEDPVLFQPFLEHLRESNFDYLKHHLKKGKRPIQQLI